MNFHQTTALPATMHSTHIYVRIAIWTGRIDYELYPSVHSVSPNSEGLEAFIKVVEDISDVECFDQPYSAVHFGWTPKDAIEVAAEILDRAYGLSWAEVDRRDSHVLRRREHSVDSFGRRDAVAG